MKDVIIETIIKAEEKRQLEGLELVPSENYVSNDVHSAKLNEIRPKYYDPLRPPAASKAMVKEVGKPQAGVSIDMIGVVVR